MLGWVMGRKVWADFTWCIGRLGCFFIKSKSRQLSSKHFVKVLLSSSLFFPNITNYIMATEQNWSRSMVYVPLICILEYCVQDLTNSHHLGFVSWTRTQPNPRWKSCESAKHSGGKVYRIQGRRITRTKRDFWPSDFSSTNLKADQTKPSSGLAK